MGKVSRIDFATRMGISIDELTATATWRSGLAHLDVHQEAGAFDLDRYELADMAVCLLGMKPNPQGQADAYRQVAEPAQPRSSWTKRGTSLALLACATLALNLTACTTAYATSPFEHPLLGRCFASQAEAMRPFRLPDGAEDENVVASASSFAAESSWVIDKTSSSNYQWYLLEASPRGFCYTLYVPFATDVVGVRSEGVLNIQATTQPTPGGSGYQMTFRKSARLGRFVPYRCSETRDQPGSGRTAPRAVDCLAIGGR